MTRTSTLFGQICSRTSLQRCSRRCLSVAVCYKAAMNESFSDIPDTDAINDSFLELLNNDNVYFGIGNPIPVTAVDALAVQAPAVAKQEVLELQQQQVTIKLERQAPHIVPNQEFDGEYNFEVFIDPHHGPKSPWVYSQPLNKVFILVNQKFPIDFKWTGLDDVNLFVRVQPTYSSPQFQQEIVCRCIPHAQPDDSSNNGYDAHVMDHIVRCHTPTTSYLGDKKLNQHLSVVVPVGRYQRDSDSERHIFEFVCKNSCSSGMNRRHLEVIFTLEDQDGTALGRKVLNVRVCSCPKRDKEKEERQFHRKNENKSGSFGSKKRKLEKKGSSAVNGQKEYRLDFKVPDKECARRVLRSTLDIMSGHLVENGNDQAYWKHVGDVRQMLNSLD